MKIQHFIFKKAGVIFLVIALLFSCVDKNTKDKSWIDLFDGEALNGWHIKGGAASYEVRDGAIVASAVYDNSSESSFLITEKQYNDFILELDYKVDPGMNSGVQLRSSGLPDDQNSGTEGYRIEINPSERAWRSGIYDSDKGWLYPLTDNPKDQQVFKQNDWNKIRVEAIGDTIQTWLNDVPVTNLIDDKIRSGFIALEVHGTDKESPKGTEIMWRNVRILTTDLEQHNKRMDLEPINTKNRLTIREKKNGWKMLWDGKTTNGWRGAKLETFPENGWVIDNGVLRVLATGGGESTAGGDIVTEKEYHDFALKIDFKLSEGDDNSGIKYYVDTDLNKGTGSSIGLEYQILGEEHPDYNEGNHKGSRKMASLYDLIGADPIPLNPVGEWNTAKIISKDKHVEHWLNGVKVLEYERGSEDYRNLVRKSKYVKWPDFGELEKGRILLQDHGDQVSFKNIKIKEFK